MKMVRRTTAALGVMALVASGSGPAHAATPRPSHSVHSREMYESGTDYCGVGMSLTGRTTVNTNIAADGTVKHTVRVVETWVTIRFDDEAPKSVVFRSASRSTVTRLTPNGDGTFTSTARFSGLFGSFKLPTGRHLARSAGSLKVTETLRPLPDEGPDVFELVSSTVTRHGPIAEDEDPAVCAALQ